jgi:hypothetical protein
MDWGFTICQAMYGNGAGNAMKTLRFISAMLGFRGAAAGSAPTSPANHLSRAVSKRAARNPIRDFVYVMTFKL